MKVSHLLEVMMIHATLMQCLLVYARSLSVCYEKIAPHMHREERPGPYKG